jgi:hypothetical protein
MIRFRMSPLRQERLAGDIDRVRKRATTHPGPDGASRRQSWLALKRRFSGIRGAISRVRDGGRAQHLDAG